MNAGAASDPVTTLNDHDWLAPSIRSVLFQGCY